MNQRGSAEPQLEPLMAHLLTPGTISVWSKMWFSTVSLEEEVLPCRLSGAGLCMN